MKYNQSTIKYLFVLLFFVLCAAAVSAQEKETKPCENSCCDGKTKMMHQEKMDDSTMNHSMMDHKGMNEKSNPITVETADITIKKVNADLVAWNAVCPVRGEEIDPEGTKVEYNGKIYGFCCSGCISKFEKDPEKYSKNISDDGKSFLGTH